MNWEWLTRRLLILASYGFNMDHYHMELHSPDFLTDEWLEKYHGGPLPRYVRVELASTDYLLQGSQEKHAP